jgi:hypothetical protein
MKDEHEVEHDKGGGKKAVVPSPKITPAIETPENARILGKPNRAEQEAIADQCNPGENPFKPGPAKEPETQNQTEGEEEKKVTYGHRF